jgi:hypothetical protein
LVTRQPDDRAGQATLNLRQLARRTMEVRRRIQIFIAIVVRIRAIKLIGCSAFCGLFAHLFNRAIGGGEVQLSIHIADHCGGKLLPGSLAILRCPKSNSSSR